MNIAGAAYVTCAYADPIELCYAPSTGLVYVLFFNADGVYVQTIDVTNPTAAPVTLIADTVNKAGQGAICTDGSYLYVSTCTGSPPDYFDQAYLLKYNLTGSQTSPVAGGSIEIMYDEVSMYGGHACGYDGLNIYVTSPTTLLATNLAIARFTTSPFALSQAAVLGSEVSDNNVLTNAFDFTSDYVWCGSEATGNVVRFQKSDLTQQSLYETGLPGACFCVYNDGTKLWCGGGLDYLTEGYSTIAELDPDTGSVLRYVFPAAQYNPNKVAFVNGVYYWTFYQTTGQLWATTAGALFTAP
jgi:hypothetical protein